MQAPCMNAGEMQVDIPKGNMLYYDQAGAIPFVYDDVPKGDGFDDCFRYGDGELKSNTAVRTGPAGKGAHERSGSSCLFNLS